MSNVAAMSSNAWPNPYSNPYSNPGNPSSPSNPLHPANPTGVYKHRGGGGGGDKRERGDVDKVGMYGTLGAIGGAIAGGIAGVAIGVGMHPSRELNVSNKGLLVLGGGILLGAALLGTAGVLLARATAE